MDFCNVFKSKFKLDIFVHLFNFVFWLNRFGRYGEKIMVEDHITARKL